MLFFYYFNKIGEFVQMHDCLCTSLIKLLLSCCAMLMSNSWRFRPTYNSVPYRLTSIGFSWSNQLFVCVLHKSSHLFDIRNGRQLFRFKSIGCCFNWLRTFGGEHQPKKKWNLAEVSNVKFAFLRNFKRTLRQISILRFFNRE